MSGANGMQNLAVWNREHQFQSLQSYGTVFSQSNMNLSPTTGFPQATFTATPVTAAQLLADWVLTASSPLALTAPSNTSLNVLFEQLTKYQVGNAFTVTVTNFDVVSHTLTFGAGYQVSPNPLVIPALSRGTITIELQGIPCQFLVRDIHWSIINNTNVIPALPPAFVLPAGVLPGDLLEWSGTAWNPSSTYPGILPAALLNQISPFPTPTAPPFQKLSIYSGLNINQTLPGSFVRPFNGADLDSITFTLSPTFNFTRQAVYSADNPSNYDAQNAAIAGSTNYLSNYSGLVSNFTPLTTANLLWHYLGLTNGTAYGMDVGAQFFGTAFNVVSDRRQKKNLEPRSFDSRDLRLLLPTSYHLRDCADDQPKTLGLIADEVGVVVPEAVTQSPGEAMANLNIVPLVTALVGYCKDLEERLTALELRNSNSDSQLTKPEPDGDDNLRADDPSVQGVSDGSESQLHSEGVAGRQQLLLGEGVQETD